MFLLFAPLGLPLGPTSPHRLQEDKQWHPRTHAQRPTAGSTTGDYASGDHARGCSGKAEKVRAYLDRAIFDDCRRLSTARFAKSLQRKGSLTGLSFLSPAGTARRWKEKLDAPSDGDRTRTNARCALSARRPLGESGPSVPGELRRSLLGDANCVGSRTASPF